MDKSKRTLPTKDGQRSDVWISETDEVDIVKWRKKQKKQSKKRLPHFHQFESHNEMVIADENPHTVLQRDLFEFFNRTTISGLLQIVSRRRWSWRLFWTCVSLVGLAMSFYQSQDVLADYFSGKTIQIIRYNNVGRIPFPSLTVCSNIRLHHQKATPELAQLLCSPGTSIFDCSRTKRSTTPYGEDVKEDRRLLQKLIEYQLPTPIDQRSEDFYGPHRKFLHRCSWKGVPCNLSDTREIYFFNTLLHGQCFTFNLGMNIGLMGRESREFIAVLNMDRLSRKLKFNDLVANFWVHPPGTSPGFYSDNAGRIFPGDKTRIDFTMQTVKRLDSSNCVDSRKTQNRMLNPYYSSYTPYIYHQSSCIFHQEALLGEAKNCYHATVEKSNLTERLEATNGTLCTTFDCFKLCTNLTDEMLDNDHWPSCQPSCSEYFVRYGVNTMSLLLENVMEETILEDNEEVFDGLQNPFSRVGAELRNRTIAVLQLSPEHNIVEDITEENKYTVADFLGILGGNIGLWVGVSVISLAEVLELIYISILMCFYGPKTTLKRKLIIMQPRH